MPRYRIGFYLEVEQEGADGSDAEQRAISNLELTDVRYHRIGDPPTERVTDAGSRHYGQAEPVTPEQRIKYTTVVRRLTSLHWSMPIH